MAGPASRWGRHKKWVCALHLAQHKQGGGGRSDLHREAGQFGTEDWRWGAKEEELGWAKCRRISWREAGTHFLEARTHQQHYWQLQLLQRPQLM